MTYSSKLALLHRDLLIRLLVDRCTIEAVGAYKLLHEAIIRKAILDQVEIGEDIYYKVNWRDDLNLENFWQEPCLQDERINFWMQEKN